MLSTALSPARTQTAAAAPPALAATGPEGARILVASDNAAHLAHITERLREDHATVSGSVDATAVARDFEASLPHVLVLAFDAIHKSDRFLLSLHRQSALAGTHAHRTVLLCNQAETRTAFDLCKKGCYDDYVLYWPMAQDGLRLSMSVWSAAQAVLAEGARPSAAQMTSHAEQVKGVESFFEHELSEGRHFSSTVTGALDEIESAVDAAIDDFGKRALQPVVGGLPVVRDAAAFTVQLERLRKDTVQRAFRRGAEVVGQAADWPGQAKRRLETMASQVRALAGTFSTPRGSLMVVDDDPVQRELIAAVLEGTGLEVVLLPDGASLVGALRRKRPDMILMDIHLPDLDGVSLTRLIRGLPRLADVPVLMLTGEASRESLAKSIEAGAVAYIVKPFTRETLMKNVDRFLPPP